MSLADATSFAVDTIRTNIDGKIYKADINSQRGFVAISISKESFQTRKHFNAI